MIISRFISGIHQGGKILCVFGLVAVIGNLGVSTLDGQALRAPADPGLVWRVFEKSVNPQLPTYQAGRIDFDGQVMTFIVPLGYLTNGDKAKSQFQLTSQESASATIMNFISGKNLKATPVKERMESTREKLNRIEAEPAIVRFNALGKSVDAFEYVYTGGSGANRSSLKVLHGYVPFGEGAIEVIIRAPMIHYEMARQEIDLFFMSSMIGDIKNPPTIPELGTEI